MEDAHLALLDLQQHHGAPQEEGERQGGLGCEEVRMFGVFDGHGGEGEGEGEVAANRMTTTLT